jgi:hypothetical protein
VFSEIELLQIVENSKMHNLEKGITGVLISAEGLFLQVLEGDKENVVETYRMIKRDPRHFGCIKVLEQYSDRRLFDKWSMGFKSTNLKTIENYLKSNNRIEDKSFIDFIKTEETSVLSFLHSFYKTNFEPYNTGVNL